MCLVDKVLRKILPDFIGSEGDYSSILMKFLKGKYYGELCERLRTLRSEIDRTMIQTGSLFSSICKNVVEHEC